MAQFELLSSLLAEAAGGDEVARKALSDWLEETGWVPPTEKDRKGRGALVRALRDACQHFICEWANGYAEPGCAEPEICVVFGNWNDMDPWVPARLVDEGAEPEDRITVGAALEMLGCALEWSDEWTTCGECGRAVRTQPDCYHWTPAYDYHEGEIRCSMCIMEDPQSHVDGFADTRYSRVLDVSRTIPIDLTECGFVLLWDGDEVTRRFGSACPDSRLFTEAGREWRRFLVVRDQREFGLSVWVDSEEMAEKQEGAAPSCCRECEGELDTDCHGRPRCFNCDGPCPCCSDSE